MVLIMTHAGTLRLDFPALIRRIFIAAGLLVAIDYTLSILISLFWGVIFCRMALRV